MNRHKGRKYRGQGIKNFKSLSLEPFFKTLCLCASVPLCLFVLYSPAPAQEEKVEQIAIQIQVKDTVLHESVLRRLEESFAKVAEKAILGRPVSQVKQIKDSLQKVLEKIFNELPTGFHVKDVNFILADTVNIQLSISPKGTVVKQVRVAIDLSTIHSFWQSILDTALLDIREKVNPILLGVPVDASDWVPSVVSPVIDTLVQTSTLFPGFDVEPSIQFGEETVIILKLKPQDPIVRQVSVSILSDNMPNVVTTYFKKELTPKTTVIAGLPVEFVQYFENYLRKWIVESLKTKDLKKYHWSIQPVFVWDERSLIELHVESYRYQGKAEGLLNISADNVRVPDVEFRGWAGKQITSNGDLIFMRTVVEPRNFSIRWQPGVAKNLMPHGLVGSFYELNTGDLIGWAIYKNKKYRLEWLHRFNPDQNELSAGYWLGKFIRLNVVKESHVEPYVRLGIDF